MSPCKLSGNGFAPLKLCCQCYSSCLLSSAGRVLTNSVMLSIAFIELSIIIF